MNGTYALIAEPIDSPRIFTANLRRKLEVDPTRPRYLLTEQGVGSTQHSPDTGLPYHSRCAHSPTLHNSVGTRSSSSTVSPPS